jgi:hypothetical protein
MPPPKPVSTTSDRVSWRWGDILTLDDDKGEMSYDELGGIIILGTSAAVRGGHHTSLTRGVHFFVIWTTRNVFLI